MSANEVLWGPLQMGAATRALLGASSAVRPPVAGDQSRPDRRPGCGLRRISGRPSLARVAE